MGRKSPKSWQEVALAAIPVAIGVVDIIGKIIDGARARRKAEQDQKNEPKQDQSGAPEAPDNQKKGA